MKSILTFSLVTLALSAGAVEICDFSLNPEARDGHTPADSNRFFTVCASKRFEAHPSSVMLPDDKTIIAFWDYWQGGPCGPAAVSRDAGRTWTRLDDRIPKEFSECYEGPKVWRFVDPKTGRGRLRAFASYAKAGEFDWRGAEDRPLAGAMPSVVSEDDGETWKFLPPLGTDFACVVGFSGMMRLKDGTYLGVYSRGRNPNGDGGDYGIMGAYSRDGGLTWEKPFEIALKDGRRFFVPILFRSPDGQEICCLAGDLNGSGAWTLFSRDEGKTWSEPSRAKGELSGIEHSVALLPDGRIVAAFHAGKELRGWLAPYEALHVRKTEGLGIRLAHNYGGWGESGSPNAHVRADGEILVLAHSQLDLHRPMPLVFAMAFRAPEVERMVAERTKATRNFEAWNPFAGTSFKPLKTAKLYGPFAQEIVMKDKKIERTIEPYNGKKSYIMKVAGSRFREITSETGSFEIADRAGRLSGNAAILVWTVRVPEDCKARLRLVGAPSARCCVGERTVLPAVLASIFEPRTAEIALKKGDNEISAMVYQPQHRAAGEAGFTTKPMRISAGLELRDFTCLRDETLRLPEDEMTIDTELEAEE